MESFASTELQPPSSNWRRSGIVLLLGMLAVMWAVQIVDEIVLSDRLEGDGIRPRSLGGLAGILWSPFLHAGFAHLIANTVPFVVLGGLVVAHGRRRWAEVTIVVILVGGALTWLLARGANHIGASGLIFGYFGYLVGSAFFRRSPTAIVTAVVAVVIYGGIIAGFTPRAGISWEGHLFGALAGLGFAKVSGRRAGDGESA